MTSKTEKLLKCNDLITILVQLFLISGATGASALFRSATTFANVSTLFFSSTFAACFISTCCPFESFFSSVVVVVVVVFVSLDFLLSPSLFTDAVGLTSFTTSFFFLFWFWCCLTTTTTTTIILLGVMKVIIISV